MKSTWAFALALAFIAVSGVCIADDSYAESEFPSLDEIISTIQPPDYSVDKFFADARYMFSSEMFAQMGDYGGTLVSFVAEDTFLGHISDGTLSEQFDGNYINIFVLVCLIIAVVCVLGAFGSYAKNRKVFKRNRV